MTFPEKPQPSVDRAVVERLKGELLSSNSLGLQHVTVLARDLRAILAATGNNF